MRRGTTPTISINVKGCDISDFETIYVTFKQGKTEIEKTGEELQMSGNQISILLTQEDTLAFSGMGKDVSVQIRAVTADGTAVASNIQTLRVDDILKEGVI